MSTCIFGYMRFSYLGRSDVKLARNTDIAERSKILYAPERLADRFHLLERICLPSLRWQTDQDFKFLIFTSPELPRPYKKRLARAVSRIPQVDIVYSSAEHITYAINPWIESQAITKEQKTLHFRLDDDDALASDFIATLRENMGALPHGGIITRPKGLLLMQTPTGAELLVKFEPYIAIGFAIINEPGKIQNPYQLQHGAHYRSVPSLMLPEKLAYIHTAHPQSDTLLAQGRKLKFAQNEHETYFGSHARRFRQAVARQFGGKRVEHFHQLLRSLPSSIAARDSLAEDESQMTVEAQPDQL